MDTKTKATQETIQVPVEVARMIRKVFLPINPNRMRGADPRVIQAAHEFICLVELHKPRA